MKIGNQTQVVLFVYLTSPDFTSYHKDMQNKGEIRSFFQTEDSRTS